MATKRWSSKAIWMRSGSLRGSIFWVLLLRGWFAVTTTIIPDAGSTFSPLQHTATLISSVDWGLGWMLAEAIQPCGGNLETTTRAVPGEHRQVRRESSVPLNV